MARLAAGMAFTCAPLDDGTARCWGANSEAQLGGDGTTTTRPTPVPVPALTGAAGLALGDGFGCARMNDGTARCWGSVYFGQVGNGRIGIRLAPTEVTPGSATPGQPQR